MQSRALGIRIAGLLQGWEEEQARLAEPNGQEQDRVNRRRKKHRVIIHSSPFVRCVQTSVAISAGLAQSKKRADRLQSKANPLRSSSLRRTKERAGSLSAIPEPPDDEALESPQASAAPSHLKAARLRIDAFLGEWLSPDYFENITPPPSSVMMVAGAKAELLRPGEKIEGTNQAEKNQGNFPGGWKNAFADSTTIEEEESNGDGLSDLSSIGKALPRLRSSTQSSDGRPASKIPRISTNINSSSQTYVPPTPTYAISASDTIPSGYVAHARDACVDVDYRWDSMREPQDWGDGGQYGEEWSSMHKRFRNGFYKMLDWYRETPLDDVETDVEVDTVLILVTHGAGCNALIGALTNQPVLLDVGMASLTMAMRRNTVDHPESTQSPPASPGHSRSSSLIKTNVTEEYDVKFTASTDHLKGGQQSTSPAPPPRLPPSRSASGQWRRLGSVSSSSDWSFEDSRPSTSHSLHKLSSTALRPQAATSTTRQVPGLWGTNADTASESGESDSIPNFGNANADPRETFAADAVKKSEMSNGESTISTPHVPFRTSSQSQKGLWSSSSFSRESPAKRRWTVTEQNN